MGESKQYGVRYLCGLLYGTGRGSSMPLSFHEYKLLSLESLRKLLSTSYATPRFIQFIAWPVALSGRDMVSVACTGSGKTLTVSYAPTCSDSSNKHF